MERSHKINFETSAGTESVEIKPGSFTLVAGANGVGKSALLAALYRSLPLGVATYLPGHRQINFNNGWETIGQDPAQLEKNLFQQLDHFNRYKGAFSEEQLKNAIRRLLNSEAAFNRDFRRRIIEGQPAEGELGYLRSSPIDTLNVVFEGARLPVRFTLDERGISADRSGKIYPIDAMSDGERAALFIVAIIVTQEDYSVVLIDEPEKHLHPSITSILIDACVRARPKVSIIVSSHDVFLIERLTPTHVIHIKNSEVVSLSPERRIFDAMILNDLSCVPEDLRTALLGARSEILFVEGDGGSRDIALYSHVYENMKVSPRGGHGKVQEAVSALKEVLDGHWLSPYGIIDGDGRNEDEKAVLARKSIFVLPSPSIENVFFYDEVISCYVDAANLFSGGISYEDRINSLADRCLSVARRDRSEIIALRTSWLLDRSLSAEKRSPAYIKTERLKSIEIDLPSLRARVEEEVEIAIDSGDWRRILHDLPIKKTGLPHEAAIALGATSFLQYCSVIIRQFDVRSDCAKGTLNALRGRLPVLERVERSY